MGGSVAAPSAAASPRRAEQSVVTALPELTRFSNHPLSLLPFQPPGIRKRIGLSLAVFNCGGVVCSPSFKTLAEGREEITTGDSTSRVQYSRAFH